MTLDDLSTPCLLVEKRRLENNIEAMQRRADENEVALRPHIKTHKSVALARKQMEAGAQGITVAKPSEAKIFVEAGFDDVRVAYPVVGADKHQQLLELTHWAQISFCVDTIQGARAARSFYEAHEGELEQQSVTVLIEIDTGHGRTGIAWDDEAAYLELARLLTGSSVMQLAGILTHAGHSYHGPESEDESPEEALQRTAREERDRMLHAAAQLKAADDIGIDPDHFEISIGSTPTMAKFENAKQDGFSVTEVRPGNYIFYDAMQVGLHAASLDDCALTVLTTVVSKRRTRSSQEQLYLDAGKKIFSTETGYGTEGFGIPLYNAQHMRRLPHAFLPTLSEEHGWMHVPGGSTLEVADRLRVVPNHACLTVDAQDRLYLVAGQDVVREIDVDARGKSQ